MDKYKHLLGVLNHTKHTNYGAISNKKKTTKVYQVDRKQISYRRALLLCEKYNVSFQDEWRGTREGSSLIEYKVKCNVCGEVYKTNMHSASIKRCPACKDSKYSSFREVEVQKLIESYGYRCYRSVRDLIKADNGYCMEVDLYVPDLQVAFEFNGYAYHTLNSLTNKWKDYHKEKTVKLLERGIKLYHIWSDTPDDLVRSIVQSKIGVSKRIYARNCEVIAGSVGFHSVFHVDGDCRALARFSLAFNGEEVCQLSVRNHKEGLEIARFSTILGITVVGGYSKLLSQVKKFAIENGYTTIVSYCNRDLSPDPNSSFYAKYGFEFVGESSLILKYVPYRNTMLNGVLYKAAHPISRQRCQRHLLVKELQSRGLQVNANDTEKELAEKLGIYQCFNSGDFKYILNLNGQA